MAQICNRTQRFLITFSGIQFFGTKFGVAIWLEDMEDVPDQFVPDSIDWLQKMSCVWIPTDL
jgi:hypothetical protein